MLGTLVEVAADREEAIEAAFAAVSRVHHLMSAHEKESDVGRINRLAHVRPVTIDPWTAIVLERAAFWAKESRGAFDVVMAGHTAIMRGQLPRHEDQALPVARDQSILMVAGTEVRLAEPGAVDLGGIAKGFAVDVGVEALREHESTAGVVNAGGDIAGFGTPWPIVIRNPITREAQAEVVLQDRAIATSALVQKSFDHICDPAEGLISATVCAPKAVDADVLTKVILSGSPCSAHCLNIADGQAFSIQRDGTLKQTLLKAA